MTFHYPTSDIVNTTVGQSAMTIAAGDSVLIASDIHVIDTNANSTAIDGSDASGARITVQGTVAAESYGILLAFGGSPNDNNLVTVAEGGHVEAYSPIYTWGDGNVVNVFGDVVGGAFGVSQTGDATSVNQIRVSGSVVSAGTALDLTNGVQHVTNTGLIQGGYSAGLASDFQTLHLNNAGTIAGASGIFLHGTDAVIANSGDVFGAVSGAIRIQVESSFRPEAHRHVAISNDGTIAGATGIEVIPYAGTLSDVTMTVRNSGTISGDVIFDRGNDLYDGATGVLLGTLDAGAGHDTILGGDANETFLGGAGFDSLRGGGGEDSLNGGADDDTILGGDGDDTMDGGTGIDQMDGGAGNDGMLGGDGVDIMQGGTGNDFMLGQAGNDTMDGGADNDTLQGGDNDDMMKGGAGDDLMQGQAGADEIDAGDGNDTLQGGDNDDMMKGGAGNDLIQGQAGADEIDAGDGNDTVNGGAGADSMDGGSGVDLLSYQGAGGAVNVNLGTGETVGGEAIFDIFTGFEQLEGTGFNDILTGSATADTIWGGHGDDQIAGGNGNDVLRGGDGFDILTGGAGRDILIGGAGIDHFRFTAMGDLGRAAGTRDVIRDFQTGVDKIDLSQIDPIAGGADDAFVFRAGNAFTGTGFAEVRVVASGNDMTVQLDADGNGVFDAAFTINGNGMPLVTDFFL